MWYSQTKIIKIKNLLKILKVPFGMKSTFNYYC